MAGNDPNGGGPFRQNAKEVDPEAAAIEACVARLDKIETLDGLARVLRYLTNRYLQGEVVF